ncbi:hypothetical protein JXO59_11540 [candidate division KSB1 bacterium]|nr:hypothetical protein [candidate division KSB1 bacterium]
MLALLLKNRLTSWYNSLRQGEVKKRRRRILGHIGLTLVPVVIFLNILFVYKTLLAELPDGEQWLHFIFSSSILGLFLMLLFSGLTIVIHSLFLSKDLTLLLSSPISRRTIFQFKLIDAAITNSTLFFAVGVPLILALGLALHLSPFFYIYALMAAMLFICIPVGLAAALAIGLVSIIPAKKAKNIATVIFSLLSLLLWGGLQYIRPERIHPDSHMYSTETIRFVQQKSAAYVSYFPSQWLSDALFAFTSSDFTAMATNLLLLTSLCLALYVIATALLQRAVRRDLFSGQLTSIRLKSNDLPVRPQTVARSGMRNSLIFTLWLKDIKLLLRDSRYTMQIFLYAVIMIVFPLIGSNREAENLGALQPYFPYLYLFLFSSLMAGSWASRLIPAEGLTFSYVLCAPQRRRTFLLAKILASASITLLCGLLAMGVMHLIDPAPLFITFHVFTALLAIIIGSSGVGIVSGAYFANFKWEHPKRMLSSGGNMAYMISIFLLLGLYALVVFLASVFLTINITLTLLLLLAALLAYSGTVLSEKKLDYQEWLY